MSTVVSYHEGVGTSDKLWTKDWTVRQPSFDSPITTYDGTTFSHNGKDTITRVSWNGNGTRDTMKYIKYQKFMKKDSIRVVSETRNK